MAVCFACSPRPIQAIELSDILAAMHYKIRHVTKFQYTVPIAEAVTEVRMHPRLTAYQSCTAFRINIRPSARLFAYEDHLGNVVHHFTQPGVHQQLSIVAESQVEVLPRPALPALLGDDAWAQIDALNAGGAYWDMVVPSAFTEPTDLLNALAHNLDVSRRHDPLVVLHNLNHALHRTIAYAANSTRVDSPIDEALTDRRGVCQDYTHIMLAIVRSYLGIPCRYVSGYLYHSSGDRSADGASHAWLDVMLPGLGWIGFDPTNDILVGERHIEVAVGRDYQDAPPTRGVFKGTAGSDLTVGVRVRAVDDPKLDDGEEVSESPVYRSTAQQLQARYAETLLAMQMQQQ